MKCPVCKTELAPGEMLRLETLEEHVCDPNAEPALKQSYHCSNPDCSAEGSGIIWNRNGERYGAGKLEWIDGNDAPFGSFERKMKVEIYKTDENYFLGTIPCWPLKGWRVKVVYNYKSNEDGDILKRRARLEWHRPERDGMYAIHIWGIRMLRHGFSEIWREWRAVRKNPSNIWAKRRIEGYLKRAEWRDAEWWRKCSAGAAKVALKTI